VEFVARRRHGGEVEQAEAGQLGDDAAALDDAGQRQAQLDETRAVGAQPGHGE
jgi:hypothetical protein